jgi:aspartyl-tRNA(Asn)/glutamyl-tRNA(Gln) amidotransferase subunit C
MKIDREMIRHLETLARIELRPEEIGPMTEQLDRIVNFVEKLQAADTSGITATKFIVHADEEHLRDDEVKPGLDRDTVLEQAPDTEKGFFRVPRVIDRGEV